MSNIDLSKTEIIDVNPRYFHSKNSPNSVGSEKFSQIKLDIDRLKEEPQGLLVRGIQIAQDKIVLLEKKLGVVVKDRSQMPVVFFNAENYHYIENKLTGRENSESVASEVSDLDEVLITNETLPVYHLSSVVFHELIHKHIDRKFQVRINYKKDSNNENEGDTEDRRCGLNLSIVNPQSYNDKELGGLLNETGNYIFQAEIIKELLRNPEFKEESDKRENLIKKLEIENDIGYPIIARISGNELVSFSLSKSNIHFDLEGNMLLDTSMVIMQLGTDLVTICGPEFQAFMLRAKAFPESQIKLMNLVDQKLGKGFYRRFKNASYNVDEAVKMLAEVQKHL